MSRIDDFQNALDLAVKQFRLRDPVEICYLAGAKFVEHGDVRTIVLPFLQRHVTVVYPAGIVQYEGGNMTLSLQEQGLVLHYLLGAKDIPLTGNLITFREIPSGEFYYQPFLNRAQVPLVKFFGMDHLLFKHIAAKLGGVECTIGDTAMAFLPFPKTPVTLVLWKGDEEFPPDGTILFDSSIKMLLNAEDIAFLASTVVYKLLALSRT